MMNEYDIKYIAKLLNDALKTKDWDHVAEAQEYLQEFQDTPVYEEE